MTEYVVKTLFEPVLPCTSAQIDVGNKSLDTGICQYSEHCDQYTIYVTKQNCNIVHMYFIIFQNVSALKNVDCRKLKSIKDTLEKKSKMSQGKCHRTYANNLQCIKQILKVASEV